MRLPMAGLNRPSVFLEISADFSIRGKIDGAIENVFLVLINVLVRASEPANQGDQACC